jgi:cytochrome P450
VLPLTCLALDILAARSLQSKRHDKPEHPLTATTSTFHCVKPTSRRTATQCMRTDDGREEAVSSASPVPRSWPVVGILPAIWRAPHQAFADLHASRGDYTKARLGPRTIHVFNDPVACRALLQAPEEDTRKSLFYDKLRPTFGDGLLTSGGDLWRRQRALIQPLLTPRAVAPYAPVIVEVVERLLQRWQSSADAGEPVDAAAAAGFVAREVTVRALFGDESEAATGDMTTALAILEAWIAKRFWALVDPELLPNPGRSRHRRAVAEVDRLVYGMIARRRREPEPRDDLLSRLLRAHDDEGAMTERQLRDEVTTLYLAGQETTAQSLAFTLWLLARHPLAQEKVRDETAAQVADRTPTAEDARRLPWTRACIDESLRLFPPVWALGRETCHAIEVAGHRLDGGSTCTIVPWVLHRRADVWDAPAEFRPERFLERNPSRAFMPFGAGHRICVGRDLALLELVLAVAMLVRRFHLEDATAKPLQARALVSLVPDPAPRLRLQDL